jgi:hypothetical protein
MSHHTLLLGMGEMKSQNETTEVFGASTHLHLKIGEYPSAAYVIVLMVASKSNSQTLWKQGILTEGERSVQLISLH